MRQRQEGTRTTVTALPPEERLVLMLPHKIGPIVRAEVPGRSLPIVAAMATKLLPDEVHIATPMEITVEAPIEIRLLPAPQGPHPCLHQATVVPEIPMQEVLVAVTEVPGLPVRLGHLRAVAVADRVEIKLHYPITKSKT